MSQIEVKLPLLPDGQPGLPSAVKQLNGEPRFHLALINELVTLDPGIRYLVLHEMLFGGFEAVCRQFFDEHLQPGDVFIDVGAHWGVYSLSAATRWPGQIDVLAIEPHPLNVLQLLKSVVFNGVQGSVEIAAVAAGAKTGTLLMRAGSTMGYSLDESVPLDPQTPLRVAVVTLEELIAARPDLAQRRLFLKIDTEGFEYEVILGARRLLESGRVAAVMWEKGTSYAVAPGRDKVRRLMDEFRRFGFTLHRFASTEFGGPLIPFAATAETGNVFALAPGFSRRPLYPQRFDLRPPFNPLFVNPAAPAERAVTTELLQAVRSSDGARWAHPEELKSGADARALVAARYVPSGSRVLDLGAGAMALKRHIASDCSYIPADLIARSTDCLVLDLNQGQFPRGQFDVVALLEVLEYIHDVPALLRYARTAATRLVCSYNPQRDQAVDRRRQQGWFNDHTSVALTELLRQCGWKISEQTAQGACEIFCCIAE
ncbi:MAG: FkbM family methyltransferase [Betaproteobacteria bacterium]